MAKYVQQISNVDKSLVRTYDCIDIKFLGTMSYNFDRKKK